MRYVRDINNRMVIELKKVNKAGFLFKHKALLMGWMQLFALITEGLLFLFHLKDLRTIALLIAQVL